MFRRIGEYISPDLLHFVNITGTVCVYVWGEGGACVRACVRACVHACVRACVCVNRILYVYVHLYALAWCLPQLSALKHNQKYAKNMERICSNRNKLYLPKSRWRLHTDNENRAAHHFVFTNYSHVQVTLLVLIPTASCI